MKRKKFTIFAILILLIASLPITTVGAQGPIKDPSPKKDNPDYNKGIKLPFDQADKNAKPPLGPGKIGDTKTWLALDDFRGVINLKDYTLRAVGTHAQVWVANNLNFPNTSMLNPLTSDPTDFFTYNDCRKLDGVSQNVITDANVAYLIDQFDNNMYPIEAQLVEHAAEPEWQQGHAAKGPGSPKATTVARATTSSSW